MTLLKQQYRQHPNLRVVRKVLSIYVVTVFLLNGQSLFLVFISELWYFLLSTYLLILVVR